MLKDQEMVTGESKNREDLDVLGCTNTPGQRTCGRLNFGTIQTEN